MSAPLNSELQGKVAVITGSTSGIGWGIAQAFARSGANVVLNGLGDSDVIEAMRRQLSEAEGVEVTYSSANMLEPDEITQMIDGVHRHFGRVDCLVNNAGTQYVAPIQEFPDNQWERILRINLSSAFYTIKATTPHMIDQGWGRIINIASVHALVASPYKSAYVAAKHGIAGLTKTVALELARENITVNAIAPGYVDTPLVANQIEATAKARGISAELVINDVILAAQPTKQFVSIEHIAELCITLCCGQSAAINGAIIPVDGGWSAQ